MTNILLNKMTIRNFKGFKEFVLDPQGSSINVSGDNGTGKTSLYDAFLWCLFGKNSADQADTKFSWKPLDENNNEIHRLETSVELELQIDSKVKTLKRIIVEDWVNKRGQIDETFNGHTTTYQIDGINVKQKEYKAYLDTLIGEETFRLLTNVTYFPEKLEWKKRRELLIDMVGDITDLDVIKSNEELEPLEEILGDRSADDAMTLLKQRRKQINKQIGDLPGRIDEVDRSLPEISHIATKSALEVQKAAVKEEIEEKQNILAALKNGGSAGLIREDIAKLTIHKAELEKEYLADAEKGIELLQESKAILSDQVHELRTKQADLNREIQTRTHEIVLKQNRIIDIEAQLSKMREVWDVTQAKTMAPFDAHALTCPTCNRDYDEAQALVIQSNYDKEVDKLNQEKSQKLEELKAQGASNNENILKLKKEISNLEAQMETAIKACIPIADEISKKGIEIMQLNDEVHHERTALTPFVETEAGQEIQSKIQSLNDTLSLGQSAYNDEIIKVQNEISELQTKLNSIENDLYALQSHAKQSVRKEELISEEQALSVEFGKLEQQLFLLEEFIRTKVDLLTDGINSKFQLVKFKLFKTNNNGGIEEICEPLVNGVPYSTGLNNAAKINAGLDIIRTLANSKNITIPVFVDNAEGVNQFIELDTQLITLSVTKHKTLRAEAL